MTAMTDDDLAAIEKKLKAATPGPWRASKGPGCRSIGPKVGAHKQAQHSSVAITAGRRDDQEDKANATFIAAAPTDVRRLLDDLRLWKRIVLRLNPNPTGEYVELPEHSEMLQREQTRLLRAPDMLPLRVVQQELGKSRLTLLRWITNGKMPAKKIGAQWHVQRAWIEEAKR